MSLIRWNPSDEWLTFPFDFRIPSLIQGFNRPRMDVSENEKEVIATAEVPGIDKNNIEINIQDNILEIKGQTTKQEEKNQQNYYMSERYYGAFSRRIVLPAEVDADKATATFENGVLTIRMPKVHPDRPKGKRIPIQ
ncbi:heat shock protein Hsp20 [Caldanaerobius fijiensis DSM 17918]|uniref:Heat shock protein Hsp20 n=1 Tax=Caldanaerobius fijiensis DSM 17918 TaxID=1121256 RepID=A0A1M5C2Q8_9THEO|nr:Hsp20/alpha crystallin family protein [Caldanaerobius fijiensis]SHF49074.1 heat shock protein Hsp20 [Caldanaerobius fijiensis DSM 17918]